MKASKSKNHTEPKTRLISKFTVVLLSLSSLTAFWLVAPTKLELIKLIERSSSPQVSITFLKRLYDFDPTNQDLAIHIIENYIRLGQFDDAKQWLQPLLVNEQGEQNWNALEMYLSLLLAQAYQAESLSAKPPRELNNLFNQIQSVPDPKLARKFADAAIAFSLPSKGLDYLYPHRDSDITNYQELVSLALQTQDYDRAILLQTNAFQHTESMDQAQTLFDLFASADQPESSRSFINNYRGTLQGEPAFLASSIAHSKQIGNLDVALSQSEKLLTVEPSNELYRSTAELATSAGELPLAASLLETVIELDGHNDDYQDLHEIYQWQGEIGKAQSLDIALLSRSPSEAQLRNGVKDSSALSDIYYEGVFYDALANRNLLHPLEYDRWLNSLERAKGTDAALKSVNALLRQQPSNTTLMSHKMRLHSYQNNPDAVLKQWNTLIKYRAPTEEEAILASNAFIATHQPEQALQALTTPKQWLKNSDESYLYKTSILAWNTGNREIATLSYDELATRKSASLDVYRYIRVLSPLDKAEQEKLLALYNESRNSQILLALIHQSQLDNDSASLRSLIALAQENAELDNNLDVLRIRADFALQDGDTELAMGLLDRILMMAPGDPFTVNTLLWLAIENHDKIQILALYEEHKQALAATPSVWLAFASANQLLENYAEAEIWYKQLLSSTKNPDVSLILNYATLKALQGETDKALALRKYVLKEKQQELLALEDDGYHYRTLIGLFTSPRFAQAMLERDIIDNPTPERITELYSHYLANNQTDRIVLWQKMEAFKQYVLPDWQQLALAMQQDDTQTVKAILSRALHLAPATRYAALQKVGQNQQAWEEGEQQLGTLADKASEAELRRIHVQQHPDKNQSLRTQVKNINDWNVTRSSVDYYAPHENGRWQLGADYQTADAHAISEQKKPENERRLRGSYHYKGNNGDAMIGFDVADGVGDQRLGVLAEYQHKLNKNWQVGVKAGVNTHIEASELLNIAGQDNTVGVNVSYHPTARESVSLRANYHDLESRFGDEIGKGWDVNLRATEQVFFNDPAWEVYADVSAHKIDHSDSAQTGINRAYKPKEPITSEDFISDEYQRIAVGQRISHGTPGEPGPTVPSPHYWLDTSVGYNLVTSKSDLTVTGGVGVPITGNDELYLTTSWQSQDRNGDQSLQISVGYTYKFK